MGWSNVYRLSTIITPSTEWREWSTQKFSKIYFSIFQVFTGIKLAFATVWSGFRTTTPFKQWLSESVTRLMVMNIEHCLYSSSSTRVNILESIDCSTDTKRSENNWTVGQILFMILIKSKIMSDYVPKFIAFVVHL